MRLRPLRLPLLLSLLASAATLTHATCESGLAERMYAKLHLKRPLVAELAACKPWPAYAGRSIVVLPLVHGENGSASRTLDLEVLLIQRPDNGNTERDTVLARLYQPEVLEEDAIRIEDIRIDTARYVLAPESRAFGLRVRYRGTSHANPFASETLRLYMPQGAKLRQVLGEIEMDRDSGDWDPQCNGRFEQLRAQLSVSRSKTDGMADLALSRTLTQSRAQARDDGVCSEKAAPAHYSTAMLRYDGEQYPVPKTLRAP
jgi:hypothetical protein